MSFGDKVYIAFVATVIILHNTFVHIIVNSI